MPYLTFDEFKKMSNIEITEKEFDELLPKASAVLDNVTSHFYQRYDILLDNSWRVKQFKKALCAQIEYFNETGATTSEALNKTPHSFSAGRTTVTNANRSNSNEANEKKSIVSEDVYLHLEGTGLLFAGVAVW